MKSLGLVATTNKGRTTGFDYLRLGLSLSIVTYHCLSLSSQFWSEWFGAHRPILALILPAFFALSGFLVIGSLFRNTIPQFIALRALRLVPALAVEVTLSAIFLGAAFTTLPLREYFTSPEFWAYFLNIVGEIHFFLPGVFHREPVNSQLWTIPYELKCYGALIGVAIITRIGFSRYFPAAMIAVCVIMTAWAVYTGTNWSIWHPSGRTLVVAFLWACALYVYRDRIPHHAGLACLSLLAGVALLYNPRFEAAATLPIAYLTVYIGLLALPRIPFGDLSYGIFLFHLPIMQMFRFGPPIENPYLLLGLTTAVTALFSLASWNLIEKPCLSRKADLLRIIDFSIFARRPVRSQS